MLKVAKKYFVIFCTAIIFIIALILLYPKSAKINSKNTLLTNLLVIQTSSRCAGAAPECVPWPMP